VLAHSTPGTSAGVWKLCGEESEKLKGGKLKVMLGCRLSTFNFQLCPFN
jgi:hypothetical protein